MERDENGNFIYFYAFKRKQYWLVNFALNYIMLFQNIHVIFKFENLFFLSCLDKFGHVILLLCPIPKKKCWKSSRPDQFDAGTTGDIVFVVYYLNEIVAFIFNLFPSNIFAALQQKMLSYTNILENALRCIFFLFFDN